MVLNVRQKQIDAVVKLLHFNQPPSGVKADNSTGTYKVLILDKFSKDLLSPLLHVNDLRKHGVTLHLGIEAVRQPISEVPAVYLVQPTQANVAAIVADTEKELYEQMYINFVPAVPHNLLEELAEGVVKTPNGAGRIAKVFDQYLAFVALEKNLFSLSMPRCYAELNDPSARDTEIEATVSTVVDGLFSVFLTLGAVPIIRCPKGGAPEHIAAALDAKMRDALKLRNNLFSEASSGLVASIARPLLVLFDRDFDLSVAVQHTFSYKPLVQDVLGMRLNRITVGKDASPGGVVVGDAPKKASYDVDEKDFFWETCGSLPFPKVAEEVENQLQNYKKAAEEVTRKSKGGSETVELDEHNTENLMSAVSSLPELTEKKKVIDKHFNIASALLEEIKGRTLNLYYNLEEDILTGKPDLAAVLELLKGNKGTHADRQRLALVCLLASDAMPTDSDLSQIEAALRESGADTTGFSYVRTLRKNNLAGGMKSASNFGALSQLAGSSQSNLLSWAEKTFGQGLSTVTKGVKNLLSGARRSPVVAALDSLMAGKSESGGPLDDFATFDPRGPPGGASDRSMGPYREAVVCMIGGGTYLEHEALQAWAASCASPRQVVYGATEILSAEAFLQQLADLGRQTSLP